MSMLEQRRRTDPIEMLEEDHQRIRHLFRIHQSADHDARPLLASKIFSELVVHTMLEERIFYPTLEMRSRIEGRGMVEDARITLTEIKELIEELRCLTPEHRDYEPKLRSLRMDVEHHLSMVEEEMFPLAERILDGTSSSLGEAMLELRLAYSSATPL